MAGEIDLEKLLRTMSPTLNAGNYVFCTIKNLASIDSNDIILFFREQEGITVIVKKETADKLKLDYSFVASWITLSVHSSLEAVGFTAAFSKALADEKISCNVVAAYFHDHIFVDKNDVEKTMIALSRLSGNKNG